MRTAITIVLLTAAASAQTSAAPTLAQILSRMAAMNQARAQALRRYESVRTYEIAYNGFPKSVSATAKVRIEFTAPDEKRFTIVSESGSKLLLKRVINKALESEQEATKPDFRRRSALEGANYEFQFIGNDSEAGRPCYLLQVKPRREDKYLYDGQICVDSADYAVARIEARPAKNPSFWISKAHIDSHSRKHGDFWFPSSTDSTSHVRLGGNAELKIEYGEYRVIDSAAPEAAH